MLKSALDLIRDFLVRRGGGFVGTKHRQIVTLDVPKFRPGAIPRRRDKYETKDGNVTRYPRNPGLKDSRNSGHEESNHAKLSRRPSSDNCLDLRAPQRGNVFLQLNLRAGGWPAARAEMGKWGEKIEHLGMWRNQQILFH